MNPFKFFNSTAGEHLATTVIVDQLGNPTSTDPYLEIAKGNVSGQELMSKFGQNEAMALNTWEDIWDGGGTYAWPADGTAPITHIVSDTALEVLPIEVEGLDIDGYLTIQTVSTNGTTLVPLTTPLWRVFRMRNMGAVDCVADIKAVNAGDTVDYAIINNGHNQTLMALYTIPKGKTGYLLHGNASLVGLVSAYQIDGHFYMREPGGVFQIKTTFGLSSTGSSNFTREYKSPIKILELTDLKVSGYSTKANGVVNASYDIILIDN